MGLRRYLRQSIAASIVKQLDAQGELLFEMHLQRLLGASPYDGVRRLERHGFRTFSQNDEDGILEEIFGRIGITHRTFVEFGVQDGLQSNTRLLLYQGWRGLWIEADGKAHRKMRRDLRGRDCQGSAAGDPGLCHGGHHLRPHPVGAAWRARSAEYRRRRERLLDLEGACAQAARRRHRIQREIPSADEMGHGIQREPPLELHRLPRRFARVSERAGPTEGIHDRGLLPGRRECVLCSRRPGA